MEVTQPPGYKFILTITLPPCVLLSGHAAVVRRHFYIRFGRWCKRFASASSPSRRPVGGKIVISLETTLILILGR
ncbi:hypothetical protein CEXT_769211 [Caerostris extrusa]|uniref:Uncharacterized protein n=1 Tax=Caerostris extrusa TaxID=172846 RepID=A0AAV4XCY8_CAEEX|nr:hypothetical protein CEXT_769211 [Caerostris extrusa]